MTDIDGIPLEGVLDCLKDPIDFPDLLMAVSRSGRTGRMRFSNPDGDKVLDVHDGRFVFAKSSSPDDGLGQYLLRHDKVSLVDYDRISKEVRPGKRLGSLLVKEGILDAASLVPAVVGQVRQVILTLFRANESIYRFQEAPIEAKERITLNLPISELIIDGIMEVQSWRRVARGVGGVKTLYKATGRQDIAGSSSDHIEQAQELLDRVASAATVGELCTASTLKDFDVCRYLWAFRILGWTQIVDLSKQERTVIDVKAQAKTPVDVPADLEKTVVDVSEKAKKIAELEKTVVSTSTSTSAAASAAPKPIPEDLMKTQVAVERPKEKPEGIPDAAWTSEPSEYDPQRTRVFDTPSELADPPERAAPTSTAERMESILEGNVPPESGATPGDASTQMFDTSNALDPKKKKPSPDDATTQYAIDPPDEDKP